MVYLKYKKDMLCIRNPLIKVNYVFPNILDRKYVINIILNYFIYFKLFSKPRLNK